MSEEIPLRPWEVGYIATESVAMSKKDAGRLGGLKQAARKAAGLPPLPRSDGTGKPGRKLTSEKTIARAARATAENLPLKKKLFLDAFVYYYLHNFNSSMAYISAGGQATHATTGGPEALRTAYVQEQIRQVVDQLDEEQLVTRKDVIMGIKTEAHYHGEDGSSAARVRAWAVLAKIKGMDQPKPVASEDDKPRGGVMEIPAQVTDVEWTEVATASQFALKNDVRK